MRQKKDYPPLSGQSWYEKALDWMTREERSWLPYVILGSYLLLLFLSIFLFYETPAQSAELLRFLEGWCCFLPLIFLLAMINPLAGIWELFSGRKLKEAIREDIQLHGSSSYDELASRCRKIKTHLGLHAAVEDMLSSRELIREKDGLYRLPTEEDEKRWLEEWLAEYGAKISFADLERLFARELNEWKESLDIGFCLRGRDVYSMGKMIDKASGKEIFWYYGEAGPCQNFGSFQELTTAALIEEQTLEEIWEEAIITFLDDVLDMEIRPWLSELLS